MEELEVVATEGAVAEVFELLFGGAHIEGLGLFDEGANDVGLFAGVEAFADELRAHRMKRSHVTICPRAGWCGYGFSSSAGT